MLSDAWNNTVKLLVTKNALLVNGLTVRVSPKESWQLMRSAGAIPKLFAKYESSPEHESLGPRFKYTIIPLNRQT